MLDNQNKVDAYLRGEMNDAERKAFEQDIKSDEPLHQDYILTKEITDALTERQKIRQKMNQWELESKLQEKFARRRKWISSISVAAAVAVIIIAVSPMFVFHSGVNENFTMPSFEHGSYYRTNDAIFEVDSLINKKDYMKALSRIEALQAEYSIKLTEYTELDSLSPKQEYQKSIIVDDIYNLEWRRINLLFALDETEEATSLLLDFKRQNGEYQNEASELYDKMK